MSCLCCSVMNFAESLAFFSSNFFRNNELCLNASIFIIWKATNFFVLQQCFLLVGKDLIFGMVALLQDFGEESEGLNIVQEYVKNH